MEESETIDFQAMEQELQMAVAIDEKNQRENDAKLKAVQQKVETYEEFRDIVQASHLKPLKLQDKLGARNQPWNMCATKEKSSVEVELSKHADSQPRTAAEFSRDWRRYYCTEPEKYAFLLTLGAHLLGNIFHAEIGFGLLGEFLIILCDQFQPEDTKAIYWILLHLSQTQRFGLNVDFLNSKEREKGLRLFQLLEQNLGEVSQQGSEIEMNSEETVKEECAPEEAINRRMLQRLIKAYRFN